MKRFFLLALAALLLASGFAAPAAAALRVDVNQGNIQPLPIATPDFAGATPAEMQAGANIAGVVRADLERSGLFKPLDSKSFIEKITNIDVQPNFANWRVINAQALVPGQISTLPDGQIRASFRLWDVFGGAQIGEGLRFDTPPQSWRRIAHKISDVIYERITGEKGYFDTRVVFISESGPVLNRVKRLTIMDQDGYGPQFLTDGKYPVLSPRFNQTEQMIAYMSYETGKPRAYIFDLETGKREVLGNSNMSFAPRFSPDGNQIVLTEENGGNSDIYIMDLRTRAAKRLTTDPSIDDSPSFSPDGKQIVFESDRGGSQQIYLMNIDGSNQHRISFSAGKNGTPVWSPRGDLIAFTKQAGGKFNVGVVRPDGTGERILTTGWQDEGPTWAPNGRVLMYTRTLQGGKGSQIWSIDITGRNERRVITPGDASDPAWSPLIHN